MKFVPHWNDCCAGKKLAGSYKVLSTTPHPMNRARGWHIYCKLFYDHLCTHTKLLSL